MTSPVPVQFLPGIKRDGTRFDGDYCVDGRWCRFSGGKPKKIGGYQAVIDSLTEKVRGLASFSADSVHYLHAGSESQLKQYKLNSQGIYIGTSDRTPAGLGSNPSFLWQFDHFYDSVAAKTRLIAHAAPNLAIDNTVTGKIWYGDVDGTGILTDTTLPEVDGGVVALGSYLMSFGSNGRISYTAVNNPASHGSTAFITPQKIIRGLPLRGSGSGPAGLFWSLDSLIRATWQGGTAVWAYDTITSDISIISAQSVIEYDGIYYWIGVDRFMMFNGVVRELPNELNSDYFFEGLNFNQRQRVFAYKVPRYGEIWWCYPRGSATECTHAIVYNVRENTWYDTELPSGGRSAGIFAKVYHKPFMADADNSETGFYSIWQHETAWDKIRGSNVQPIESYFETNEVSLLKQSESSGKAISIERMEMDIAQTGPMTLRISGRKNPRAPITLSHEIEFPDSPGSSGEDQTITLKETRRLMSFKFCSNAVGGTYELGKSFAHIQPTDQRTTS